MSANDDKEPLKYRDYLKGTRPGAVVAESISFTPDLTPVLPKKEAGIGVTPASEVREQCGARARAARDSFREACESEEEDQADACFAETVASLKELWPLAVYRAQPFKDLLGALDAALRYRSLGEFEPHQRDALRTALSDLPKWHLADSEVESHLRRFAEHGIDITGPVTPFQVWGFLQDLSSPDDSF